MTPFEALYDYKAPVFAFTNPDYVRSELKDFVEDGTKLQSILKESLEQA